MWTAFVKERPAPHDERHQEIDQPQHGAGGDAPDVRRVNNDRRAPLRAAIWALDFSRVGSALPHPCSPVRPGLAGLVVHLRAQHQLRLSPKPRAWGKESGAPRRTRRATSAAGGECHGEGDGRYG